MACQFYFGHRISRITVDFYPASGYNTIAYDISRRRIYELY